MRNNGSVDTIGTVKNDIEKIKSDVSKMISNNVATKDSIENLTYFETHLSKHIQTVGNLFSLDNINSLTTSYIYCMNKLNYTLNCINQYSSEIIEVNSYAKILRPIFEKKYTDNLTSKDGYVFIDNIIPTKIIYFFEADSMQDDATSFTGKYANLEPLRFIRENKRKSIFMSSV
jgi:hypothetical protein